MDFWKWFQLSRSISIFLFAIKIRQIRTPNNEYIVQLCNITFYCMYWIAKNKAVLSLQKKVGEKCQNVVKIISGWISADSCGAQMFNIRGFGQKLLIISRSVYFPLDKSFECFSTWEPAKIIFGQLHVGKKIQNWSILNTMDQV